MTENIRLIVTVVLLILTVNAWRWAAEKYGPNADLAIRLVLGVLFVGSMVGLALFA